MLATPALIALSGASLIAWRSSHSAAAPLKAAVAMPPPQVGSAPTAASLLDASGYVVARRRATVASKVTGKVIAVALEEGQRVEAGQIIARLDDSTLEPHGRRARHG